MAWRRPGDKPLSEPVVVNLLTHIWVTRPQWVNTSLASIVLVVVCSQQNTKYRLFISFGWMYDRLYIFHVAFIPYYWNWHAWVHTVCMHHGVAIPLGSTNDLLTAVKWHIRIKFVWCTCARRVLMSAHTKNGTIIGRWVAVLTFLNEICCILIKIPLIFAPNGPIHSIAALLQTTAWRRSGDKPLSDPIMAKFTDAYMRHLDKVNRQNIFLL